MYCYVVLEEPMCFLVMTSVRETTWNAGCTSEKSSITIVYRKFCASGKAMVALSIFTCYSRASTKLEG